MPDDRVAIPTATARALVAAQFPAWAHLPVTPVDPPGWDNRTFRLGPAMKLRFPSAARYVAQVEKEARWLPVLAPRLPLPVPEPLAVGAPGAGYPFPWSVQSWLPGQPASLAPPDDPVRFALDLAAFISALRAVPAAGGPRPAPTASTAAAASPSTTPRPAPASPPSPAGSTPPAPPPSGRRPSPPPGPARRSGCTATSPPATSS